MHPKTLRNGPICLKPFALTKPTNKIEGAKVDFDAKYRDFISVRLL